MRKTVLAMAAMLAACGGQQGSAPTTPVASSSQALREFMRAAADSNLTRMSELWGSSRGPAAQTRVPENYEKRLAVIQSYLRADSSRIVSDMPDGSDDNRRRLMVQIYRQGCMKQIPATMLRIKGGWMVLDVELAAAGNPARPCEAPDADEGDITQ
jgi:hypothetical protein